VKHFVHNVSGRGRKDYGIGGIREILNLALMIFRTVGRWKTMGKKSKLASRANLHHSQGNNGTMTNTMKSNFPDVIRDVVYTDHRHGPPRIDETRRMIRS
jgi:hypothetical protein